METEDTIKGLWNLALSSPHESGKQIAEARILDILDALLASGDLALMELIPIFLSLAAQSGFSMNLATLFHKYGIESQQGETLQKLLLITLCLLKEEGLPLPADCGDQEKLLKTRWGDLVSSDVLELGNGISLNMDRLREVFRRYASQPPEVQARQSDESHEPLASPAGPVHPHLRLLFSPKQEDLIQKKLKGEPLSKTEREYYSRVVKKKLKALTDKTLQELASRLTGS